MVVTRSLTRFTNMSDGINDLVTELSGNKPIAIPHPESSRLALYQTRRNLLLIFGGQTVNTDQFAFIHFNVITLTQGRENFRHHRSRYARSLMNIIHNTNT